MTINEILKENPEVGDYSIRLWQYLTVGMETGEEVDLEEEYPIDELIPDSENKELNIILGINPV